MSVFRLVGRDGKISILAVSLYAIMIGVVLMVGAYISFQFDRSASGGPLLVPPPPEAVEVSTEDRSETQRITVYNVPDVAPETVVEHYNARLARLNNNTQCDRTPATGNMGNYTPGSGNVPFFYTCLFEVPSVFNANRLTSVLIEPGLPERGAEGQTVIIHEMIWGS